LDIICEVCFSPVLVLPHPLSSRVLVWPHPAWFSSVAHHFFLKGSALDFAVPICLGVVLATVFCLGLGSVFVFRALDLFSLSVSTDILSPDLCADVIFLIQLMLGFFHSCSRVGQFSALR
jgi:hypothetical protein